MGTRMQKVHLNAGRNYTLIYSRGLIRDCGIIEIKRETFLFRPARTDVPRRKLTDIRA